MADLFVSYKSEDRPRVQPLVEAFQADGVSVWWDAHIGGGAKWRESIEANLASAGCVIVVWSNGSTGPDGHFVRDEATRAQRRRAYLPVRIDAVEPPLGFGEIQALSLIGWKGDRRDPRYQTVLDAAKAIVEGRGVDSSLPPASPAVRKGIDRRLLLAGGLAGAGAAGVGAWQLWPAAEAKDMSIAVMPFANLSGDPSQAYFADGLSEELRSALTHIPDFSVIGRTSSEALRDKDARTAAAKLGVANILTGSVRRSPTTIRIAAQLIDGRDGVERWSETYDRPPGDALEIQSAIAQSVAGALRIRLLPAQRDALVVGGTRNAEAHDLLLRAKELVLTDTSPEASDRARALLDTALALDGNYADAYALRGALFARKMSYAQTAREAADLGGQAQADAHKALAIAPKLPLGYRVLGLALSSILDVRGARRAYEQGVALGSDPTALRGYAQFLSTNGEAAEAMRLADRAVALDPLAPTNAAIRSVLLYYARRYSEALAIAASTISKYPKQIALRQTLTNCLIQLGRYPEALDSLAYLPADDFNRMVGEAIIHARKGERVASDRTLESLKKTSGDSGFYQYAEIYAQQGEKGLAIDMLEAAWKVRDGGLVQLPVDPFVDPVRDHPRFKVIARQIGDGA